MKTESLNDLFAEWKRQKFLFCEDGIVCDNLYSKLPIKPLFVLKDVHQTSDTVMPNELSSDGVNIDMRKAIFIPGQEKTWKAIAYWTEAFAQESPQSFQDIQNITFSSAIQKCAFINIKKDEGAETVCGAVLMKYAKRDKALLRRQIAICDPDVIIACSRDVTSCLEIIYPKNERQFVDKVATAYDKQDAGYGEIYRVEISPGKQTYIINYRHPNRLSHETTYNDMLRFRQFLFDIQE